MRLVTIENTARGATLATRAEWRRTMVGRGRGLLGRTGLEPGEGIVIDPCGSVHMFFMRFTIDIVFLDRQDRVVKIVHQLRPWRLAVGGRRAHRTLELPAGSVALTGTAVGDQLTYADVTAGVAVAV